MRKLLCLVFLLTFAGCTAKSSNNTIRIGTKNFTEQFILGELMAQLIESRTNIHVKRVFNLGGTMICHSALLKGEIDLYAEYTGTALTAILKRAKISSPQSAYNTVKKAYQEMYGLEWLEPFGFNNTFTITVRNSDAEANGWKKISDLKKVSGKLRAGFTAEFVERPDGYPGLKRAYGFQFGSVKDLDPGLMYQAQAQEEVDVICAFATDGRIVAYDFLPLIDDRGFFAPYYAASVIRGEVLKAHPEIRDALAPLAGLLNNETMQKLNFQVDEMHQSPKEVAQQFLKIKNLI